MTSMERRRRRTRRQSHPKQAGLAVCRRVKPALTEIGDARREPASQQAELTDLLRVGGPVLFAAAPIVPVIAELVARPPRLEIELRSSDREVDLVAEHLGEGRAVVFGPPSYFQRRGRPNHPNELAQRDCVVRVTDGEGEAWPFRIAGRRRLVRASGRVRTDSTAAANTAVACGAGIGFPPLWLVRSLVDRGEVEIILEAFEVARVPIHAVWLPTRVPLAKAQLFVEAMIGRLKRERL